MARPKLTPEIAYSLAWRLYAATGERDTRLESVIAQNPMWAYLYARDILKGPWPEAESMIAQDATWAYWYAKDILKSPWPEAEEVIAQDATWRCFYARDVLKTPEDHARFKEVQR